MAQKREVVLFILEICFQFVFRLRIAGEFFIYFVFGRGRQCELSGCLKGQ